MQERIQLIIKSKFLFYSIYYFLKFRAYSEKSWIKNCYEMVSIKIMCCKKKKAYKNNRRKIVDKLLSIDFIWKLLLENECKQKESIISINK
jgi:hypothetical protein